MTGAERPPRLVPLLYVGTAYVSLALACALAAIWPRAVALFFYHSWMVAIVHLITLGWITCSILGAIYIVGPVALRMPMPARRGDYVAYGLVVTGIIGMVAHFWIEEFGGMAWSAATVTAGALYVVSRVLAGLRRSSVPASVKLHIRLACVNFVAAASAGILLGFDKVLHFLPGFVLSNVFAHAHLAALGWATMMVIGVAYRLLPMVLPSRMPTGRSIYANAILLELWVCSSRVDFAVLHAADRPPEEHDGLESPLLVGSGAWALFASVAIAAVDAIGVVAQSMRRPADSIRPAA